MKGMAALAFGLVAVSCNKSDIFNPSAQQEENEKKSEAAFAENVMAGQAIDANQTWSTAVQGSVSISVNLDADVNYSVYVFTDNPVVNKDAAYIGTAVIKSGQTKTVSFARPADVETLFAAYMDPKGNLFAVPFSASDTKVTLGVTKGASNVARRAGATVSVTTIKTPDVSSYKTGAVALTDANAETVAGPLQTGKKMIIEKGTKLTAILANVKQTNGGSVYVEGEWEISGDQRFAAGTHLIIANGGKVTVTASGNLLSNNDNNNQNINPGLLYVMAGGKLTGDGNTNLCNAAGNDMCYIGGTVDIKEFNMNGSKVYVDEGGKLLSTYLQNGDGKAVVINHGEVHVKYASDATGDNKAYARNLAIENACQFTVDYQLTLSNWVDSKIADNGYLSVGALKLDGGNGGQLYMGENAVIEIGQVASNKANFKGTTTDFGEILIGNFNVVGPTSSNQNRAFIKCEKVNNAYGYGLTNKITLIVKEIGNFAWMEQYFFTNGAMFGTTANYTIDTSECTAGIQQEHNTGGDRTPNYVYYAFEDLGTTNDFDFNDVVIRVSTPDAQGNSTVELMCAGGTMSTEVTCGTGSNVRTLGSEVHTALGASSYKTMVNTGGETKPFPVTLGTIEHLNAQTDMTNLPLGIKCEGNNGQVIKVVKTVDKGKTPLVIVVSGDENGKWYWPTERTNITTAYPGFGEWGANVKTNTNWYKNAAGSVYAW